MKNPVSLVLVGAGGMGSCYLKTLFKSSCPANAYIHGIVEPQLHRSASIEEITKREIPVFPTLEDFFANNPPVDLVIIASPVHHHVSQSCLALHKGSHVLCEKPLAATVQDARCLIQETRSTEFWVKIGYQWSFSEAIQALKKDITVGRFGRPLRLKTLCFWPRDLSYFRRNDWAGKTKDDDGRWILDSPANNAMAHFLHNVLYILGDRPDSSAKPREITAELYRANPIENYDTIACRLWTMAGVEILFYASHSTFKELGPLFSFEFEKGIVSFGENGDAIVAHTQAGEEVNYGSPEKDPFRKLWDALSAVRATRPVICGPEASFSQTVCVNGIQESMPIIHSFPQSMVEKDKNRIWVNGLTEEFYACYQRGILPGESGLSWASRGKNVDLQNYEFFPGGTSSKGD
ncbi:MAG: Gfo/Idh/MocA family oxidoreductase [Candidatus Aminicenantes bacterium]|jgi:predicted dehydrogenase